MEEKTKEKIIKAGKIAAHVKAYARELIKPSMPLFDIAEKIEAKIIELGAKPAFPINLSKNEIAAHFTPSFNGTDTASGLLKVDIGVHIDGYIADTAFTMDMENLEENRRLIKAAETALQKAVEKVKMHMPLKEIGETIEKEIKSFHASPIRNLSGHSIEPWNLHAGITIPNFNNMQEKKIGSGLYAIEPFATTGFGSVKDSKPSGIYTLKRHGSVRDALARKILHFIEEEYKTLPFCSRWLQKRFGTRALIALKSMEELGILHHYPTLIESSKAKVSQAEHTVLLTEKEKIVTT